MARAVYQHELQDPDFSWLITRFQELYPQYYLVESTFLPLVLIQRTEFSAPEDLPTTNIQNLPSEPSPRKIA